MSMVNFDENQIIANGARIYDQRAKIEAIADSIVDNGFDLLLFTSSGGSQAMLDPFAFYIRHMSRLPVENVLSANLMTGDCNRITDKTVAFLTSKSGDTAETVKAANWLKEQGVRLFAAVGKENSTLESICDDTIVYGEGRPQELVFYLLIGRILYRSGNFDAYPRFADELKNLAFALAQVRKQADAKCLKYAQDYCKEPITSGSAAAICGPPPTATVCACWRKASGSAPRAFPARNSSTAHWSCWRTMSAPRCC